MSQKIKTKVNGRIVEAEILSDDEYKDSIKKETPLIANPRIQQTALFISGVGLGLYKGIKSLLGYVPNPTGDRVKRALPWALLSGMAFFIAPSLGKGKTVARVAGGGLAIKAGYEFIKKPKTETVKEEILEETTTKTEKTYSEPTIL